MSLLSNVQTGIKKSPLKILIYGDNGVGKSTFASQAPSPIFLNLEDNIDHLDVAKKTISSYKDFTDTLNALLNEDHSYKTLVIDSIDALEQKIWEEVCSSMGNSKIKTITDIGFGAGYSKAQNYWHKILAFLDLIRIKKKMHILLIGHSVKRNYNNPQTVENYDRFELRVYGSSAALIGDWCNCILFATTKIRVENGKATSINRVLYTQGSDAFFAKSIFPLKEQLAFSWKDFTDGIKAFYQNNLKTVQ